MKDNTNDLILISIIGNYCNEIERAIKRFSINGENIATDADFRALLAFFVMQIGETANGLSDDFIKAYTEIDWSAMRGLRNRIAHSYGNVDPDILWDTVKNDIPELGTFCKGFLKKATDDR